MESIDSIKINFNQDQLLFLNLCLAFLMFGVALDLKPDNFSTILRSPKSPLIGLSAQLLILPALTLGIIFILEPPTSMALSMILVASCPGGNVSNYAVHLAGANSALSVTLTTITTLSAIVITPSYFALLSPCISGAESFRQSIHIDPLQMVKTIVTLILIPLVAGMLFHHFFPRLTGRVRQAAKLLSVIIFLGFIGFAVYGNFDNLARYLHLVFLLVFIHNTIALFSGYWFARLNGLARFDARAIALETGIQNSGLGLILIFNFFNGLGGMAIIAAWWAIWHLISAFCLAMWWKSRKA